MKSDIIGIDYGSDSVRALLIDTKDGKELSFSVFWYKRWLSEEYWDPTINQYRQHPLDHIEGHINHKGSSKEG